MRSQEIKRTRPVSTPNAAAAARPRHNLNEFLCLVEIPRSRGSHEDIMKMFFFYPLTLGRCTSAVRRRTAFVTGSRLSTVSRGIPVRTPRLSGRSQQLSAMLPFPDTTFEASSFLTIHPDHVHDSTRQTPTIYKRVYDRLWPRPDTRIGIRDQNYLRPGKAPRQTPGRRLPTIIKDGESCPWMVAYGAINACLSLVIELYPTLLISTSVTSSP